MKAEKKFYLFHGTQIWKKSELKYFVSIRMQIGVTAVKFICGHKVDHKYFLSIFSQYCWCLEEKWILRRENQWGLFPEFSLFREFQQQGQCFGYRMLSEYENRSEIFRGLLTSKTWLRNGCFLMWIAQSWRHY